VKLQDATRAITRKPLKDQPDGFIADFSFFNLGGFEMSSDAALEDTLLQRRWSQVCLSVMLSGDCSHSNLKKQLIFLR
jgi:hypothetical protein